MPREQRSSGGAAPRRLPALRRRYPQRLRHYRVPATQPVEPQRGPPFRVRPGWWLSCPRCGFVRSKRIARARESAMVSLWICCGQDCGGVLDLLWMAVVDASFRRPTARGPRTHFVQSFAQMPGALHPIFCTPADKLFAPRSRRPCRHQPRRARPSHAGDRSRLVVLRLRLSEPSRGARRGRLDRAMRDAFRKLRCFLMTVHRLSEDEAI